MEQGRKWFPYLIIALVLGAVIFLTLKGCKEPAKPSKTTTDTIYVKGKTDTLRVPGIPDTVTKFVPYPVFVEKPAGQHFGKDSSVYTVSKESGNVAITTFPATDSIRIEIEPITIERLITRVDTLRLHTVDTLKITNTIEVVQPWYDTFLTGFITAVLAVAGVIGAFAL